MDKKKLIIDTDGGCDDAMAIVMALNDPAYEVVMISTVAGNVLVDQATRNVLTTIEHANTYEPPVYKGSNKMLFHELGCAFDAHGSDGLGDIGLVPVRLKEQTGSGAAKIIELLKESEAGEIDIVALGPLTNLALAARLDEDAFKKAGRIIIMGSAGLGDGNVSPVAEFNIWQDAEAAKIVLDTGHERLIFVGWDACVGDCLLSADNIRDIRESGPVGAFTMNCSRQLIEFNKKNRGVECLDMADPAAMAAALYPECVEICDPYYCQVDISAGPSYGALVVDKLGITEKQPNAYICSKLYADQFKKYIYQTIGVNKV